MCWLFSVHLHKPPYLSHILQFIAKHIKIAGYWFALLMLANSGTCFNAFANYNSMVLPLPPPQPLLLLPLLPNIRKYDSFSYTFWHRNIFRHGHKFLFISQNEKNEHTRCINVVMVCVCVLVLVLVCAVCTMRACVRLFCMGNNNKRFWYELLIVAYL